jgi:hypothetical protein
LSKSCTPCHPIDGNRSFLKGTSLNWRLKSLNPTCQPRRDLTLSSSVILSGKYVEKIIFLNLKEISWLSDFQVTIGMTM